MAEQLTTFDYLLNRMELAASANSPAKAGYAKARKDVLGYIAALRKLNDGQARLLAHYRFGNCRTPEVALTMIGDAECRLAKFDANVARGGERQELAARSTAEGNAE